MLILRTQEIDGSEWTYEKARRELVKPRVGFERTWHWPARSLARDVSNALSERRLPKDVHLVLKTKKAEYFLIREARLMNYWKESGIANFTVRYGKLVYVDPESYRTVVKASGCSWLGKHARRQLVHLADKKYERELRYVPKATGRVARFLFYNQIEQRIRTVQGLH